MFIALLASVAVAASLADGPPPPITVSLNDGGQYNRGDYAKVQFRANADGYVLILQTDQNGRIRVLFPLDPGDDNFIRGGKTYKIVGRDNRGSFYLDQAGGSGMVYAAWSKSPFQAAEFVRGDHWDYSVFDQYSAADDPESQLTDFVLHFTSQDFDYAIDRYIVYTASDYSVGGGTTYIGVSGWPWPSYYAGGWGVGVTFGSPCCYDPWPWYGWYPAYGWGYPAYGWGYPGYGWGYPGYGYGGGYYPGYPPYGGYPGYGYGSGYPRYNPYTFKPGGTVTTVGNPYRPRGDIFAPGAAGFQTTYRDRPTLGMTGTGRLASDAATINGHSAAGRRPAVTPASGGVAGKPGTSGSGQATGGTARRPTIGSSIGATPGGTATGTRRTSAAGAGSTPRARSATPQDGGTSRAHGWTADGTARPAVSSRPRVSTSPPSTGRGTVGEPGAGSGRSSGGQGGEGGPSRRPSSGGGQPAAQPQSRPSGGQPGARSSGGGSPSGGGARSGGGGGGGGGGRGAAPSGGGGGGGGGGGRRGR